MLAAEVTIVSNKLTWLLKTELYLAYERFLRVQSHVLVRPELGGFDGISAVHRILYPDRDPVGYGDHKASEAAGVRTRGFRLA